MGKTKKRNISYHRHTTKHSKHNGGTQKRIRHHKDPHIESELSKRRRPGNLFRPMNCNPRIADKTITKDSCFTSDILDQIKKSYNNHHPTDMIHETSPEKLWNELHKRMAHCQQEDCWLTTIQDNNIREHIDKIAFAPFHPDEWNQNNNTWLSNLDIDDVLTQYESAHPNFELIGPSPIDFDERPPDYNGKCVWDELCQFSLEKQRIRGKTKIGIVFNLDEHTGGGSHWVALFIDIDDSFIFYMDSAGNKMPKRIRDFVHRVMKQGKQMTPPVNLILKYNYPTEHQFGTTECGMYCLFFIITMLTGKAGQHDLPTVKSKIDFFKKQRIPDRFVNDLRQIYYNKRSKDIKL